MSDLRRGANILVERDLFYSNGTTPLLIADLTLVKAEIIQYNRILATYYLKDTDDVSFTADPEITGTGVSQITIEVKQSLSLQFREGPVKCKLYLEKVDAEFIVDLEFKPIDLFEMFTVI